MRFFCIGKFLALLLFQSLVCAQTLSDANTLKDDIFQFLCQRKEPFIMHVPPGLTPAQKRVRTFDEVYKIVSNGKSPLRNYDKIRALLDPISLAGGAGGKALFFSNEQTLLNSFLACSPIDAYVQYIEDLSISAENASAFKSQAEEPCSAQFSNSTLFFSCQEKCLPGEHLVFAQPIQGNLEPIANPRDYYGSGYLNSQTVHACMSCYDERFGGDSQHVLTFKGMNGCFDMDGCSQGYKKRKVVTNDPEDLKIQTPEHLSLSQISLQKQITTHVDLEFEHYQVELCVQDCPNPDDRNPHTGYCEFNKVTYQKILSDYSKQIKGWTTSEFFPKNFYGDCDFIELEEFLPQLKILVLSQIESAQQDFDIDFLNLFEQRTLDYYLSKHAYNLSAYTPVCFSSNSEAIRYKLSQPLLKPHSNSK